MAGRDTYRNMHHTVKPCVGVLLNVSLIWQSHFSCYRLSLTQTDKGRPDMQFLGTTVLHRPHFKTINHGLKITFLILSTTTRNCQLPHNMRLTQRNEALVNLLHWVQLARNLEPKFCDIESRTNKTLELQWNNSRNREIFLRANTEWQTFTYPYSQTVLLWVPQGRTLAGKTWMVRGIEYLQIAWMGTLSTLFCNVLKSLLGTSVTLWEFVKTAESLV